jgi:hypothetical protein
MNPIVIRSLGAVLPLSPKVDGLTTNGAPNVAAAIPFKN